MLVLLEGVSSVPSDVDLGRCLALGHMAVLNGLFCVGALHAAFGYRGLKDACHRVFLEGRESLQVTLVAVALMAEHVVTLAVVSKVPQG